MTSPRGHELARLSFELPDGRESYLVIARAVIESLDG